MTPKDPVTHQQVAEWMRDQVIKDGRLDQEVAASEIATIFGEEFTYINENGNLAIDKKVLDEFRKLTSKTVVWERGERCWRLREDHDDPSSRSTY